jgi:hypothetical protein
VQPFAMLLKSYSGDLEYATRLVESFARFNADGIELFVVVPAADIAQFERILKPNCTLISEDRFSQYLVNHEVHGIRSGYINQEIVKLAFWELELAENYFCVDSDAEFIREFRVTDFMFDQHTPYSVLVQDLELAVEPEYFHQYWKTREREIAVIAETVGLDTRVVLTCHGHTVFSSAVLKSFVSDFLKPRGWTYADALELSPYEFTWYNMWLQKSNVIDIHPREPWIKVFHNESQHLEYLMRDISVSDIARGYLGVVVNSNYSRDIGIVGAASPKLVNFSHYMTSREILGIARLKLARAVSSIFK